MPLANFADTGVATAVTGVTSASSGPDLFAADANSVAYTRSPKQVTAATQIDIAEQAVIKLVCN